MSGPYGGMPPHNKTDTSYEAALSMLDSAENLRAKVWRFVRLSRERGVTCEEVELALSLRGRSASARLRELVLLNAIRDSGNRRVASSGRRQRVYVNILDALKSVTDT